MLTQVVLETSSPKTFNIEGADPDDILIVKSISGLTSTKPTLFIGEFARDAGYYQGRRAGKRNVVITFKMNPDYAQNIEISDIREMIYRAFHEPSPNSDGVRVVLKDDRRPDRYFIGYTEAIDSSQFEKEQTIMVSMVCTDPYLRSVTSVIESGVWLDKAINYDGSADTGLIMTIRCNVASNALLVSLNNRFIELSANFNVNDLITIDTNAGNRYVKKNNQDFLASLLYSPDWFQLDKPDNILSADSYTPSANAYSVTRIEYRSAWWGI